MGEPQRRTALLLIGHGTRDALGQSELQATTQLVAQRLPGTHVASCNLEYAEPSIPQAIDELARNGIDDVVAMPLLLLAAGHAKEDIPEAVAQACNDHPKLKFRLTRHLGCHDHVVRASQRRFEEAIRDCVPATIERCRLILVGRGSSDEAARNEMLQFADRRRALQPQLQIETSFLAMAEPRVEDAINDATASTARFVVVQPHLLFHGRLVDRLRELVKAASAGSPNQQWRMATYLGPVSEIADVVVERFAQAQAGT